jgi:MerR family transcriptional regulator, light-induced transcriptional regulator
MGEDSGGRHPIGVVSERTGLTQEVLRVWERRYGVVAPERGEAGQRLYSDADVERLRLLRRATQGGRSIGSVARLATAELAVVVGEDDAARARGAAEAEAASQTASQAVAQAASQAASQASEVERAVAHARALEGAALEALLRRWSARQGVTAFVDDLVAPFMRRIGDDWHAGRLTPAHEHLATSVVTRVLMGVLSALPPAEGAAAIAVSSPAGDRHEVGVLLAAVAAAAEGWRVIYLGADLPAADIVAAAVGADAAAVGLSVVYVDSAERVAGELRRIRSGLPASMPLLVGGAGAALVVDAGLAGDIVAVPGLAGLRATLQRIAPAQP